MGITSLITIVVTLFKTTVGPPNNENYWDSNFFYYSEVEFKKYLHGKSDARSRLMFKFRSGTHGLNEEQDRHRGREGMKECLLCDDECESVSHVLWECSSLRSNFLVTLQGKLWDEGFEHFQSLDSFRKAPFVLGREMWEDKFGSLLGLVKGFILDVWELRKVRLYGDNPSVQQTQSRIASGELQGAAGGRGELRCLGGETDTSCSYGVCSFVNGSAHCSGCVVYGPSVMAAT